MSEIPTDPSTTKESQEITQGKIVPLSNFNFSVVANFRVEADPSLMTAINRIADCLDMLRSGPEPTVKLPDLEILPEIVKETMEEVEKPLPFIELPVKTGSKTVVRKTERDWIQVNNNLKYAVEGKKIFVNYGGNNVETTATEVNNLLKMRTSAQSAAINRIVAGNKGKKNALSSFLKFKAGELDQEVEGSDPDAAFRPMVTPYHSTRPDGNCGKIEGTLEG